MTIMARLFAAASLAVAGLSAPLAAQDYEPGRLVVAVDQTDLATIATALGHTIRETGKGDEAFVAAETRDGIVYLLLGTACDVNGVPKCQGVMIQARFDLPERTTPETLVKTNEAQAAITVTADFKEKALVFTRYHVLDNGVTMANVVANVNVLLGVVEDAYPTAAGEE